jgi:hypothetical protein
MSSGIYDFVSVGSTFKAALLSYNLLPLKVEQQEKSFFGYRRLLILEL